MFQNPCKECIVKVMCRVHCTKLLEHVEMTTNLSANGWICIAIANLMRESVINNEVIEFMVKLDKASPPSPKFIHICDGVIVSTKQLTEPIEQPKVSGLLYSYASGTGGCLTVGGTRSFTENEMANMYISG